MNDVWNEICYELKSCIQHNVLEKEYENTIVNCMMLLGWKKFRGEIITQYAVQIGHENKYADIVVLQDGIEQFVIEAKRPNHVKQQEDEKQLFSYMRLLKHQVIFGLYIGDKIYLYYDDKTSEQLPEQIFSIEIREDDENGLKFVELFSKETFNAQVLSDFCKDRKKILLEQKQIQYEVAKLLTDKEGSICKDLLRKKYQEEGFPDNWIENILKQISITISSTISKCGESMTPAIMSSSHVQSLVVSDRKTRDRTKYSLLGSQPLAKNRFVLEVVRLFVKNNPKTYSDYDKILNALKPDSLGVIRTIDEARVGRYFLNKEDRLVSLDGITFVVCTEWGIFNIEPIIRFATEQGFQVVSHKYD